MKQDYLKRVLMILLPVTLVGFLLIAISLTFGTSDAGKAMGFLEGVLVLIAGLWVVYAQPINSFFKKHIISKLPRKNKKEKQTKENNS